MLICAELRLPHSRVTPVENLYAALPMFLYYNVTLLKPLLVPLLEQQNNTARYPYASKDLGKLHYHSRWHLTINGSVGTAFPVASGPSLVASEAIERKHSLSN